MSFVRTAMPAQTDPRPPHHRKQDKRAAKQDDGGEILLGHLSSLWGHLFIIVTSAISTCPSRYLHNLKHLSCLVYLQRLLHKRQASNNGIWRCPPPALAGGLGSPRCYLCEYPLKCHLRKQTMTTNTYTIRHHASSSTASFSTPSPIIPAPSSPS